MRRTAYLDVRRQGNALHVARRLAAYVWAGPNTVLGLVLGFVVLGFGGRVHLVRGVAEFSGGSLARTWSTLPTALRFSAITFGHVILGIDEAVMVAVRQHEHVHVRQYEAWGPFFLLAYSASSVWAALRGGCAYRDNYFEKCARAATALESRRPGAQHLTRRGGFPQR
jgi:hypothetical protein